MTRGERGIVNTLELEERLSRPDERVFAALRAHPGDITVLGAGGKMGPSLCRMIARACDELGDTREIFAASRFGGEANASLAIDGIASSTRITALPRDLAAPSDIATLPRTPNVIYMAGQKFGTSQSPADTWGMNAGVPALVAQHYATSRIVVFSTGNVYPLTPASDCGARESDSPGPVGEYAWSCLARERVFTFFGRRNNNPMLMLRLNYAVDLRYGVLVDIAQRVLAGKPVDLGMGFVNVIWQGDANAVAIASLSRCATPASILNVTGTRTLRVREIAGRFGELLGRPPLFDGAEGADALLSNSSRMADWFGAPTVSEDDLIRWVAEWMQRGGELLGKPTHFEARDGRY